MYDLVIHTTEKEVHTNRYYGRDIAEMYFEMAYTLAPGRFSGLKR